MSASETVSLVFEAEIGQLRKALEGIPGISAKEAKKITASHLAALRATEAAAKKAASATAKAAEKQAAAAAKVADEAREGLLELGDAAGLSKDVVEKLSKGMAVLNNPATLAAAAFGAMALAAVGAGVAMVSLVRAGAEAEVALRPFERLEGFDGVSPEAQANLRRAEATLDAIGVTTDRTALALGATFAPAVERASLVVVKLGLLVSDMATEAANAGEVFLRLSEYLGTKLVQSMVGPVDELVGLVRALGLVAEAAGADGVAGRLLGAASAYDRLTASIGGAGGRAVFDTVSGGLGLLEGSLGKYDERARALVDRQEELTAASRRQGEAVDRARLAWEALQRSQEGQRSLVAAELDLARARAAGTGALEDRRRLIELEGAAAKRAAEEQYLALVRLGRGREAQLILQEREALIAQDTQRQLRSLGDTQLAQAARAREGVQRLADAELELARARAIQGGGLDDRLKLIELEAAAARRSAEEQYRDLVRLGQGREAQAVLVEREAQIAEETQRRVREAEAETERARIAAWRAQVERVQQAAAATLGAASTVANAVSAYGDLEAQESRERLDQIRAARERLGESITREQERRLANAEAAEKAAATKAFRIQQAAALAEAAVAGYQAVIQALTLGPIAGPIAAAAMSAAVGLQVAAIASQSPPSFHRGGLVGDGPRAGADPSERLAVVRQGEGVLTAQGVAAAGGREGLARLNGGAPPPGQTIKVALQIGRRTMQEATVLVGRGRAGTGRRLPSGGVRP
jgi:hypothetical protein